MLASFPLTLAAWAPPEPLPPCWCPGRCGHPFGSLGARIGGQTDILMQVFDYTDENATAVSVPEFKVNICAWIVLLV